MQCENNSNVSRVFSGVDMASIKRRCISILQVGLLPQMRRLPTAGRLIHEERNLLTAIFFHDEASFDFFMLKTYYISHIISV